MSDIEHNIKWDKNSSPFLGKGLNVPKVAQFSFGNKSNLNSTTARYSIFGSSNKAKIPRLKPPYRKRDLDRFEDCFRSDGTVRNAVVKKWNFILGAHSSVSLDVAREYQNDDDRATALTQVTEYMPYKNAMDCANEILRKTNFRKVLHAAGIQASIYGRSCIEIVKDPMSGDVVRLNVLNSKLLGDVEVDPQGWLFLGVHYRDLPKHEDLLEAENIIYLTRNDYHVSAGSMFYGLSDLEPVVDGSETKRIIKQEDLKEIAKALWAGFGWMLFKDPNVTTEQMQEIVTKMKAGAWTATDHTVELHVQEIAQNAPMLLEIVNEMNLETARDLSVPSPLVGYENKQNYSNLVQTLISWKESDLDAERRWLRDVIESQFLTPVFRNELRKQGVKVPADDSEDLIVDQTVQVPNTAPLNPLQPNGMLMNQTNVIPPAKLAYDIEDPNFTPFKEKMEMTLMLYDKRLISARKVLEMAGMEDQIEETELRLQEDQMRADAMMNFQKDVFSNQVQQSTEVNSKRMNLLNKMEGTLGQLEGSNNKGIGKPNSSPLAAYKKASTDNDIFIANLVDALNNPEIKEMFKDYIRAKSNVNDSKT